MRDTRSLVSDDRPPSVALLRASLGILVGCSMVAGGAIVFLGLSGVERHHTLGVVAASLAALVFAGLGGYVCVAVAGPSAFRAAATIGIVLALGIALVAEGPLHAGWIGLLALAGLTSAAWLGGLGRRRQAQAWRSGPAAR